MTRMRVWLLTALVALALGLNFGLLSPRVADSAEKTLQARLAAATSAVRTQIELRDARLNPRLAANSPDLIDSLRPPADPTLPVPRPDEKALRAAAAAAQPSEPDLLIVATADGAAYSRRGKPAALVDDIKDLPLVKSTLDGNGGTSSFALFDGSVFRVQAARIPGSVGVVVAGQLVDDRFAGELRAAADADVTFFHDGQIVASSLGEDKRADLLAWVKAPRLGFGTLPLHLAGLGNALDGKLPRGASRYAVRAASIPLEGGVLAAVTVSANPYFGWLARYQAYYLIALALFILFGFVWGLLPGGQPKPLASAPVPAPRPTTLQLPDTVAEATARAEATLAGANDAAPKPAEPGELPWTHGEAGWGNLGQSVRPAAGPRQEPVEITPLAQTPEPAFTSELVSSLPAPSAPPASTPAPASSEAASAATPAPDTAAAPSATAAESHAAPTPALEAPAPAPHAEESGATSSAAEPRTPLPDAPAPSADPGFAPASAPSHEPAAAAPAPSEPAPARDPSSFDSSSPASSPFTELEPPLPAPSAAAGSPGASGAPFASADPFAPARESHAAEQAEAARQGEPSLEHSGATVEFARHSVASALDELPPVPNSPALADEQREETRPGAPSEDLLAHARSDDAAHFPGDEPTRVEAVSAALLDKLREKDEPEGWALPEPARAASHGEAEPAQQQSDPHTHAHAHEGEPHTHAHAHEGEHAHQHEPAHGEHEHPQEPVEQAQPAEPSPAAASEPAEPAPAEASAQPPGDPDEAHFEETYRQFVAMRQRTGEPADKVSYEKFAAKLRKNREELLAKHSARGVRFSVYLKEGRAAIKASAIR